MANNERTQRSSSLATMVKNNGLGIVALLYVTIDYLRNVSPFWHVQLRNSLVGVIGVAIVIRGCWFYKHWSLEIRCVKGFVASLIFMLSTLLFECISVRFVTAVLGLDWHRATHPLPDPGQWLFLALNEKLSPLVVEILRAHIIGLEQFLILFVMLAFSVLFNFVKAPGLGLGARYMFTMAIGRILRVIAFVSTILPSLRPWCASSKFSTLPNHPHPWAQKYFVPYASDYGAIRLLLHRDKAYAKVWDYPAEYQPEWGSMSFLSDILRPTSDKPPWYSLLTTAGGGCNDLLYSGHLLVAVLTAMAWTEAYGGWTSALIWTLVFHSAQREIRERYHYSVDCVLAFYVGIFLWKITGFLWSAKDLSLNRRLVKLEKIQGPLLQAAKDADVDKVRNLLEEVESSDESNQEASLKTILYGCGIILLALVVVIVTLVTTSDG